MNPWIIGLVLYMCLIAFLCWLFPRTNRRYARVCPTCDGPMHYQPIGTSGAWICNGCRFMAFR